MNLSSADVRRSLWPACVRSHNFKEQLAAAAAAGFTHLPIGLVTYRALRADGYSDGNILDLAAEQGVKLGHYDGFSAWAPVRFNDDLPAAARAVFDISSAECLEICQRLQLDNICATGTFYPTQFPVSQLADCFAEFCQQASAHGVRVDLEFLPMWGVPTLADAWNILRSANASNAGILLDTWHFLKGTPNYALLESLPDGAITTLQLADAKLHSETGDLFADCLRFRQLPGDGELALQKVLAILGKKKGIVNIGPEIFSDQLDLLTAEQAALKAWQASADILHRANYPGA